jgi:hypothetical protein
VSPPAEPQNAAQQVAWDRVWAWLLVDPPDKPDAPPLQDTANDRGQIGPRNPIASPEEEPREQRTPPTS